MPILIGGGALAAVLLVIVIALGMRGKKETQPEQVAQNDSHVDPPKSKSQPAAPRKETRDPVDPDRPKKSIPSEVVDEPVNPPKRVDPNVAPVNMGLGDIVAVAVPVPRSRDYLFITDGNPNFRHVDASTKETTTIAGGQGALRAIACTPDGSKAITGGEDGSVNVWSLRNLNSDSKPLFTFKEHTGPIVACAASPRGTRAVSIGKDDQLCEWDLAKGKLTRKFRIAPSSTIAYMPDGVHVLIGSQTKSAGVWNMDDVVEIKNLPGHTGAVRAVSVDSKGRRAATAGDDGVIRYWDLSSGKTIYEFKGDKSGVDGLAISPDGDKLAATSSTDGISFWNLSDGSALVNKPRDYQPRFVAFFDDGQWLVSGGPNSIGSSNLSGIQPPGLSDRPMEIKSDVVANSPQWRRNDISEAERLDDCLRLTRGKKIVTKDMFENGVEVIAVARTEKNNIRLSGPDGLMIILNWEVKPTDIRIHANRVFYQAGNKFLPLLPKRWHKIRWHVTPTEMIVEVDDQLIWRNLKGKFAFNKGTFQIFSHDSNIDVKSFQVTQLQ